VTLFMAGTTRGVVRAASSGAILRKNVGDSFRPLCRAGKSQRDVPIQIKDRVNSPPGSPAGKL
jgi:hypothetical protein